jgi:pilus assembly protein Flp/PilA
MIMTRLNKFLRAEDGPAAVEYAIMLGLILAACVAAIGLLGGLVGSMFGDASQRIGDAVS